METLTFKDPEPNARKISISISNVDTRKEENGKDYTTYTLQIEVDGHKWSLQRRYNNFIELYAGLQLQFPKVGWPEFPPRLLRHTPQDLEIRKKKLESFIQEVANVPAVFNTFHLNHFLEWKKNLGISSNKKVLMILPDKDFDPSETAIPWKILTVGGVEVIFATENGTKPACDQNLIKPPDAVLNQLSAEYEARALYSEMEKSENFQDPMKWENIVGTDFDAIILPGGHAPGMKQYLENQTLQKKIAEYWNLKRPVGAICHGVLLLSRCQDSNGKSVLFKSKVTTLPKYMETIAYYATRWKHGKLYRTYEAYCEDEVRSYLETPAVQYQLGPVSVGSKGNAYDDSAAFICVDGNLVTARWPGDAYAFGKALLKMLA